MSEIMIFLLGVVIGLSGMGLTCWLLDAIGKEDEYGTYDHNNEEL